MDCPKCSALMERRIVPSCGPITIFGPPPEYTEGSYLRCPRCGHVRDLDTETAPKE